MSEERKLRDRVTQAGAAPAPTPDNAIRIGGLAGGNPALGELLADPDAGQVRPGPSITAAQVRDIDGPAARQVAQPADAPPNNPPLAIRHRGASGRFRPRPGK